MIKIIDDKGRLFGKINVIDFLVILFLFCFIPTFYFGYKVFSKKGPVLTEKPKVLADIEMNCKFIKLEPGVLELIAVADKEIDKNGKVIGEITRVGDNALYQKKFNIGSDILLPESNPMLKELYARLKLTVEVRGNSIYYKDIQITADSPIEFKTNKYTVSAIPVKEIPSEIPPEIIPPKAVKTDRIDLYVVFKGLTENTLKMIAVGDKMFNQEGKVIAEILEIGKIDNDAYDINLGGGNFVLGEDISKKQINVKIRLLSEITDDNKLYFNGKQVLHNSLIEFKTDKYTLLGKISKIYEVPIASFKEVWVHTEVKFSGVIPEVAKAIAERNIEKDPTGRTVAILKKILFNKPSELLTLKENKFISVNHPFFRDLVINLDFLCIEKDGVLYFKNYPVKMGNNITFTTDLYSLTGTIIGLEIK